MVPRPLGSGAPLCTRCSKTVYMVEQVIGPHSKPYHKSCLTCLVCNKRLDSMLLLEHDGDAYCTSCHKAHLGQGKGGFGLSVPVRPEKPVALRATPTKPPRSPMSPPTSEAARRVEERLAEEFSGISISARRDAPPPVMREPTSTATYQPATTSVSASRPTTVAQSIDDLVASGIDVPIPYSRTTGRSATPITDALYGSEAAQPLERQWSGSQGAASQRYGASARGEQEEYRPTYSSQGSDRGAQAGSLSRAYSPVRAESPVRRGSPVRTGSPLRSEYISARFSPAFDEDEPRTPNRPTMTDYGMPAMATSTADGLPAPQRKDPIALAREREKGMLFSSANRNADTAKTYSPRTTPLPSPSARGSNGFGASDADQFGYSPNSSLAKMGLGSTVSAAAVGTPLCARCQRPVYFAEQKTAASRKWHRACLRCDGCSTTLEAGKLEEGPLSATYDHPTNIWCRTCYAKRFGPVGIGVAGMSLPERKR